MVPRTPQSMVIGSGSPEKMLGDAGSKKLTVIMCDLPHTPSQKTINKTVSVVVINFVLNGNVSFNFPNPVDHYCRYRRCTCCHALYSINLTVDFFGLCSPRWSTRELPRESRSPIVYLVHYNNILIFFKA
jgi:hypothetical protein